MIAVLETPGNSLKSSTKWYKIVGNRVEITCKHQGKSPKCCLYNAGKILVKSKHTTSILETTRNSLKSNRKLDKVVRKHVKISFQCEERVQKADCTMQGKNIGIEQ